MLRRLNIRQNYNYNYNYSCSCSRALNCKHNHTYKHKPASNHIQIAINSSSHLHSTILPVLISGSGSRSNLIQNRKQSLNQVRKSRFRSKKIEFAPYYSFCSVNTRYCRGYSTKLQESSGYNSFRTNNFNFNTEGKSRYKNTNIYEKEHKHENQYGFADSFQLTLKINEILERLQRLLDSHDLNTKAGRNNNKKDDKIGRSRGGSIKLQEKQTFKQFLERECTEPEFAKNCFVFIRLISQICSVVQRNNQHRLLFTLSYFYLQWIEHEIFRNPRFERIYHKDAHVYAVLTKIIDTLNNGSFPYLAYSVLQLCGSSKIKLPIQLRANTISAFLHKGDIKQAILMYLKTNKLSFVTDCDILKKIILELHYRYYSNLPWKKNLRLLVTAHNNSDAVPATDTLLRKVHQHQPAISSLPKLNVGVLFKIFELDLSPLFIDEILLCANSLSSFETLVDVIISIQPKIMTNLDIVSFFAKKFCTFTNEINPLDSERLVKLDTLIIRVILAGIDKSKQPHELHNSSALLGKFYQDKAVSIIRTIQIWEQVFLSSRKSINSNKNSEFFFNFVYLLEYCLVKLRCYPNYDNLITELEISIDTATEILLFSVENLANSLQNTQALQLQQITDTKSNSLAKAPKPSSHSSIKFSISIRLFAVESLADKLFSLVYPLKTETWLKPLNHFASIFVLRRNIVQIRSILQIIEHQLQLESRNGLNSSDNDNGNASINFNRINKIACKLVSAYSRYNFLELLDSLQFEYPMLFKWLVSTTNIFCVFTSMEQWQSLKHVFFARLAADPKLLNLALMNKHTLRERLVTLGALLASNNTTATTNAALKTIPRYKLDMIRQWATSVESVLSESCHQ